MPSSRRSSVSVDGLKLPPISEHLASSTSAASSPALVGHRGPSQASTSAASSPALVGHRGPSQASTSAASSPALVGHRGPSQASTSAASSPALVGHRGPSPASTSAASSPALVGHRGPSLASTSAASSPALVGHRGPSQASTSAASSPALVGHRGPSQASTSAASSPALVGHRGPSLAPTPSASSPALVGHRGLPVARASRRRKEEGGRFKEAAFRVWATVAAEKRPPEVTGNNSNALTREHFKEEIPEVGNDDVMPNAEMLRQKKISSAARLLRSVAMSNYKELDLTPQGAGDRKQNSPHIPKRRRSSFMKTTPWKTRLPPLPSVVGMHVFRRLYMAQIMALKAPVTTYQVSEVSVSDDSDDETDAETLLPPPELTGRVCAELSPEGQYAMLRAYQDRLLEKLSGLIPDLPVHLRVVQTPGIILPPIHTDGRKWRERRTERSVQDALNLLDSLEEDGSSHLADIRKPILRPTYNPLRDYRKWCQGWQGEFHAQMERERTRIGLP